MTAYCFVDTETTSLDRHKRVPWEIALCRREDGKERRVEFQMELTNRELTLADQESLDIGGFEERYNDVAAYSRRSAANIILEFTKDAVLVARQVQFDADNLLSVLEPFGLQAPWHYKMLDIGTLVKGYLLGTNSPFVFGGEDGEEFDFLVETDLYAKALDVDASEFAMHSAMGDVEFDMAVFDALMDAVNN